MREKEATIDIDQSAGGTPAQEHEQGSLWLGTATDGHKCDTWSGKQYAI